MSCFPCPFERGSSREWSLGPREQTLKGRGSWNGLPPAIWGSAGQAACLPGSVREWGEACLSWGGRGHYSHRYNAPSLPCSPAILPWVLQGLLTSGKRPVMRAKGRQTTCPERQALGGRRVEVGQACLGRPLLGVI